MIVNIDDIIPRYNATFLVKTFAFKFLPNLIVSSNIN